MFARAFSTLVLALPVLAAASVVPRDNDCNTGSLQCCESTQPPTAQVVSTVAGLLGVVIGDVTGLVGMNCSPITGTGLSGNSCTAEPVCCNGNNFEGFLVVGCTPININA